MSVPTSLRPMHGPGSAWEEPVGMTAELFEPITAERYRGIGDYALLSDCHSTALVSCEGSIDWACLRRMDEESTFARILDHDHGRLRDALRWGQRPPS